MLNIQHVRWTSQRGNSVKRLSTLSKEAQRKYIHNVFMSMDTQSIETFMDDVIDPNLVFMDEDDYIFVRDKVICLHEKNIRVAYIWHYKLSANSMLLQTVQELLNHEYLLTIVNTRDGEPWAKEGYENVIGVSNYAVRAQDLPAFDAYGIIRDPKSEDLLNVYRNFTRHFNGYGVRNVKDFDLMKTLLKARQGEIVGLTIDHQLRAYCVVYHYHHTANVVECCYDKSGSLLKLLSYCSRAMNDITFTTSQVEKIGRILPNAKKENEVFLQAVIGDKDLFEKLYKIRIISAYSAFNAFSIPLFNREFF